MKLFIKAFVFIVAVCFPFLSLANGYYSLVAGGVGYSKIGKTQTLQLSTTPPGLFDRYVAQNNGRLSLLGALEVGYLISLSPKLSLSLGVNGDYLYFHNDLQGTVWPLVNISPDFDRLSYCYKARSFLLLGQFRLFWHFVTKSSIYASAGFGSSWNQLKSYSETPLPGSSAAPMLVPFADNTKAAFAFAVGAGYSYAFSAHVSMMIGYLYLYAGEGQLGATLQDTSDRLHSGLLSAHLFTLSFLFT